MDTISLLKIIISAITFIIGIFCCYIEIKKNPDYWLNRSFAAFFISAAFGFFFYTIYHLILNNASFVIGIMITAQVMFNIAMSWLLFTELIIEFSEKRILRLKYVSIPILTFILSTFGYLIWVPTLDYDKYAAGQVDTITPRGWFIFVFGYRILLMLYVLVKFITLRAKSEGKQKRSITFFTIGMSFTVLGTFLTLVGGVQGILGAILEIGGLVFFNTGSILILKGFL